MDEQSITLLANKIVGDISFWTALIGLTGVIVGALVTGVFSYIQSKQVIENAKLEKKKELLLIKYECMYREIDKYFEYTQEVSLLTMNSIDTVFDIKKLKANLKDNDFIMLSMLYTPSLSVPVSELTAELESIIKSLAELIKSHDCTRPEREKIIRDVVIYSLNLQYKVKNIQQELAKLSANLTNT